jgi:hypothetical protein
MSTTPRTPEAIEAGSEPAPAGPVSFSEALWFWLKLGFVSVGGPAGPERPNSASSPSFRPK